jgi:cellulose synthase/poly-beta-1,6-N-acetylglucosamine synthase-like glycosyltransferase
MTSLLADAIYAFAWFDIGYFLILNTWYFCLILVAGLSAIGAARRTGFADYEKIFRSPLAPPISIIVPAHDEQEVVLDCVRGLLDLRYPEFEVIVVDDGSTDKTFELLCTEFDLVTSQRVIPRQVPLIGVIYSVHESRGGDKLAVIRKEGTGRPADAVNAGVNAARHPLVCRVDADSYLAENALLAVVKPFIEDPDRVVGAGGSVRVANGSVRKSGRVITARMPGGWLLPIQVVEYLRAFLIGRTGWSALNGIPFISGVFGIFRRDIFIGVGGYDSATDGDDVEFVTRIHQQLRSARIPYRLRFVPEPCCWTVAPDSYAELARQRLRWAQILSEALSLHRSMVFNPRYGFIGMVVLPYFVVFELGSAVIELLGLIAYPAGLALGIVNVRLTLLFVIVSIGYAILLTLLALVIEEFSYNQYRTFRDIATAALAAVMENLGYRQLHAWWRLRGILTTVRGRHAKWETAGGAPADQADTRGSSPR